MLTLYHALAAEELLDENKALWRCSKQITSISLFRFRSLSLTSPNLRMERSLWKNSTGVLGVPGADFFECSRPRFNIDSF